VLGVLPLCRGRSWPRKRQKLCLHAFTAAEHPAACCPLACGSGPHLSTSVQTTPMAPEKIMRPAQRSWHRSAPSAATRPPIDWPPRNVLLAGRRPPTRCSTTPTKVYRSSSCREVGGGGGGCRAHGGVVVVVVCVCVWGGMGYVLAVANRVQPRVRLSS
jgi:hypothetical protein